MSNKYVHDSPNPFPDQPGKDRPGYHLRCLGWSFERSKRMRCTALPNKPSGPSDVVKQANVVPDTTPKRLRAALEKLENLRRRVEQLQVSDSVCTSV